MLIPSIRALVAAAALLAAARSPAASWIESADGQRTEGAATFNADGSILLKPSNAPVRTVAWADVRSVRFNQFGPELKPLPPGWQAEDIGKVTGSASDSNGVFTLAVNGAELKEKKFQSLHFAYRVVRGEPEVVARVTAASAPAPAVGGVMLREQMELPNGYALLGVTANNRLRLETRENSWSSIKSQDLGTVSLPIWLKLTRAEKESAVQAFRSSDGVKWTQVAQTKLSVHSGPYPENSDHWVPRVFAGVALTAPSAGAQASFQCDHASISCRGFLGEYYSDAEFKQLAFARPDRKLDFWWGDRSPAPMLEPEKFSVRWRGVIAPERSEQYRFFSDAGTKLFIDGAEVPCSPWDEPRRERKGATGSNEIALVAGRKYQLRFEFAKNGREVKSARLAWSSRSQQREHLTSSDVSYTFSTNTPGENIGPVTNVFIPVGVWLRSGTLLAGDVVASDASATRLNFGGQPMSVLNHRVARIVLRASRRPIPFEVAANRAGMFLQNGDFLESELDELNDRTVIMNSVLFGRRSYSRDNSQPLAIVLNDLNASAAALSIRLNDGSIVQARRVRSDGEVLVADEALLGELRLPLAQVQEIQNNAATRRVSAR